MKRQPTDKEKIAFVTALATTEDKSKTEGERNAAKTELKQMMREFDCGCKFRDMLFKRLYQAAKRGDNSGALMNAKLFASSFKYDSLKGILKGLVN